MRIAIDWPSIGRNLMLFSAIGAFMAFINPYDAAHSDSYPGKLLYWTGLIVVGGVTGQAGFRIAKYLQQPPHWALEVLMASVFSALGVTLSLYGFAMLSAGSINMPWGYFPQAYGLVFVIALAISSIAYMFDRAVEAPSDMSAPSANSAQKFLERLPVKYRTADLYAVSSEDHYLRVHTSLGEEMILMRLADAMRELSGAGGLQTHRGWWVSKQGVADAHKENGKTVLVLKSGAEAPVSRTYTKAVKEAGLA